LSLTAADLRPAASAGAPQWRRVALLPLVFVAHGSGPDGPRLRGRAAVAAGRGRSRCTKTKQQQTTLCYRL